MVGAALAGEISFIACRSKLAEILEKILKAELIRLGWPLEKTHDLEVLLEALSERNSDLAAPAEPLCTVLNEVYFTNRYPGFDLDDPDWPVLRAQVEQVTALLANVQARLPVTLSRNFHALVSQFVMHFASGEMRAGNPARR